MTFVCGHESVPYLTFSRVARALGCYNWGWRMDDILTAGYRLTQGAIVALYVQREMWHAPNYRFSLLTILVTLSHRQCEKQHDKIYVLLGISTDVDAANFEIDYKGPVEGAFTTAAVHIVRCGQGLKLLSLCQRYKRTLSMPSWVPDWTLEMSPPFIKSLGESRFAMASETNRPGVSLANWVGPDNVTFSTAANQPALRVPLEPPILSSCYKHLTIKGIMHARIQHVDADVFDFNSGSMWQLLELIGECYSHSIMDGEGLRGYENGMVQFQDILLSGLSLSPLEDGLESSTFAFSFWRRRRSNALVSASGA